MSIHDETEFPWLRAEKRLIATAIREGKKVLGICLGAQLIAAVCGARVYSGTHKEIGFFPVQWTEAAPPRLHDWNARPIFHWHGETFDLPKDAILLASTNVYPNQAFRLGENVLGLQFHPEVTPAIIREMITHEGHELVPAPHIQSAASILQQLPHPDDSNWPLDNGHLLDILLDPFYILTN